jgi:predicted  nucleic acid-binding Zn-ribbon protein
MIVETEESIMKHIWKCEEELEAYNYRIKELEEAIEDWREQIKVLRAKKEEEIQS